MILIDTHTHVYEPQFDDDVEQVILAAQEAGLIHLVMPNIDVESIARMQGVLSRHPGYVSEAMGLHPTSVRDDFREQLTFIRHELDTRSFVAIGEIGIDLYWDKTFEAEQVEAFLTQIEWSMAYDLPIIIHSREAWDVVFACLNRFPSDKIRGVFHSFSGDETDLRRALSYPHFYIGINGTVTFKKNTLPALLPLIPLDRLLLETDSPYLAPIPKRGRRNEPAYLVHTATFIAHILGLDPDILAEKTARNACRFFGFQLQEGKIIRPI
ncbi:hydrolase, TatD family [Porphyromonas gingivalis AJW4]|uniref:TatD family hydrolase n=1 Tax=Porphyromonas gingivalis TaxID=837 RepID=UPI0006AA1F63|nr:TatD family hydrolase [Porphyromonas gingivalis]ALA93660.1 hydrolase, TatD family [Porphyromonas gingivalis AJW4]ATS06011.1 TatD family deoxyribonuclease [Porphyromonas gingivalis]PDP55570.1 TatD family deoxyribonuclease [Porphyromonas gingivalis]RZQ68505.1 TatD family deoxyribonuclease [Porphyromonas gingivalis]